MLTIYPYLERPNFWVFDNESLGLKGEAFVLGASEMVSRLVKTLRIPSAEDGFELSFSDEYFPQAHAVLSHIEGELCRVHEDPNQETFGDWYGGRVFGIYMMCWLCPALLLFFKQPPQKIYVRARELPVGVDPIWHSDGKSFVSTPSKGERNV
jgi:hypothetical protein